MAFDLDVTEVNIGVFMELVADSLWDALEGDVAKTTFVAEAISVKSGSAVDVFRPPIWEIFVAYLIQTDLLVPSVLF